MKSTLIGNTFLEFFYNESLKAATRRSSSMVLLGQRRMGKTKIFKRVDIKGTSMILCFSPIHTLTPPRNS